MHSNAVGSSGARFQATNHPCRLLKPELRTFCPGIKTKSLSELSPAANINTTRKSVQDDRLAAERSRAVGFPASSDEQHRYGDDRQEQTTNLFTNITSDLQPPSYESILPVNSSADSAVPNCRIGNHSTCSDS